MKKHVITIAGKLGSGKSSAAKAIAKELGYEHFSSGDFARKVAEMHGVTVTEWNKEAEKNPELDFEVDAKVREAGEKENLVIDSRTAFHWIPDSFKVYLDISPEIAARRIMESIKHDPNRQRSEFPAESVEEMAMDMIKRKESEIIRFKTLYSIDNHDPKNFDLLIDTGNEDNTLSIVVEKIIEAYEQWLKI